MEIRLVGDANEIAALILALQEPQRDSLPSYVSLDSGKE